MRTVNDILRSTKRYLALHFDEEWDMRLDPDEPLERPGLVIQAVGGLISNDRGRFSTDLIQPLAIYAYPEPGDDANESLFKANETQSLLEQIFSAGGEGGAPRRIPLYNYDDLAYGAGQPDEPNLVQTVTLPDGTVGGVFSLYFADAVAEDIPYNASGATIQAALESLPQIASGDVEVTGSSSPWNIEWKGRFAGQNIGGVTATGKNLNPASGDPMVTVDTLGGLDGYLAIRDLNLLTNVDPQDPKLYTVVANVRVDWRGVAERITYSKKVVTVGSSIG